MTDDHSDMRSKADRLEEAAAAIVAIRHRIQAGEPWPLHDVYGPEPEASWGPRELLAHVDEMIPFWLGEMERVLEGAEAGLEPVPFGRVATDTARNVVIGRDRTLPLRELFARLDADAHRMAERLRELRDEDGARVGLHPRQGEMRVDAIVERFVVGHLEEHVEQLEAILGGSGA